MLSSITYKGSKKTDCKWHVNLSKPKDIKLVLFALVVDILKIFDFLCHDPLPMQIRAVLERKVVKILYGFWE